MEGNLNARLKERLAQFGLVPSERGDLVNEKRQVYAPE